MATTATNFVPSPLRTAFIGLPPVFDTIQTPIPQAELNFVVNATVTAAASGEDQSLKVTCDLPQGYGYIFRGCEIMFDEAEVGDVEAWSTDWRAFLKNTTAATGVGSWLAGVKLTSAVVYDLSSTLSGVILTAPGLSKILIPVLGEDGRFQVTSRNTTIDEGPMTLVFLATFLQFDLNQAHHWSVNTPFPVR